MFAKRWFPSRTNFDSIHYYHNAVRRVGLFGKRSRAIGAAAIIVDMLVFGDEIVAGTVPLTHIIIGSLIAGGGALATTMGHSIVLEAEQRQVEDWDTFHAARSAEQAKIDETAARKSAGQNAGSPADTGSHPPGADGSQEQSQASEQPLQNPGSNGQHGDQG